MAEYKFEMNLGENLGVLAVAVPDDVVQNIRRDAVSESRPEIWEQAQNLLFSEIVTTLIEDIAAKEFKSEPDLTDDEVEQILDGYFTDTYPGNTMSHNIDDLVSGKMRNRLVEDMDEFYKNRAKFFRFTVNYTGSFSVWVKAKNEDEARDYIEEHTEDLSEYYDSEDAEYEVGRYADDDQVDEPRSGWGYVDYMNAME